MAAPKKKPEPKTVDEATPAEPEAETQSDVGTPEPAPDDDGTEAFVPLERRLVNDVHVGNPEGGPIVEFKAGTPASTMPEWAIDEIRNPHAWSDSTRDERVEFVIIPRLQASSAPAEMIDDLRETFEGNRDHPEYESAIREMLNISADAGQLAAAIVSYRQANEMRGGESYAEYVERAGELGSAPVSFDEFLAATNGVIVDPEDSSAATRGGETYAQYVQRSGMAPNPFDPVDEQTFLASPLDVAVGPAEPAHDAEPAGDATTGATVPAEAAQGGVTVEPVVGSPDVTVKVEPAGG